VSRDRSNGLRSRFRISQHLQQAGLTRLPADGRRVAVRQADLLGPAGNQSGSHIATRENNQQGLPVAIGHIVPNLTEPVRPNFNELIDTHNQAATAGLPAAASPGSQAGSDAAHAEAAQARTFVRLMRPFRNAGTEQEAFDAALQAGIDRGVRTALHQGTEQTVGASLDAALAAAGINAGADAARREAADSVPAGANYYAQGATAVGREAGTSLAAELSSSHYSADQRLSLGLQEGVRTGLEHALEATVADVLESALNAGWDADTIKPAVQPGAADASLPADDVPGR
jgi:hypothetical protein